MSWTGGLHERVQAFVAKYGAMPMVDPTSEFAEDVRALGVGPRPQGAHPEAYCHRCGGWNLGGWHAPSPVWNAVMRRADGPEPFDGIICPQCFEQLAEQFGVIDTERTGWHVHPDPMPDVPMVSADGRVWDAEQCLWIDPAADAAAAEKIGGAG